MESTVERQVRPPVDQSAPDGETHLPVPDTATPGIAKVFAKEPKLHRPERERLRAHATRVRSAFSLHESQESLPLGEPLYIDNAGLVLTAPFLPMLFNSLNMLRKDENGKSHWPDQETASRGVHLLQYLVDERVSAPEPLLVLNKLLCGLPLAMPVEKSIAMTDGELAACEKLLRSMLANWKALSGTSIAGLRETFFQRQGRLEQSDIGWKLQVQRKTVDVLVDQIPWSIAVIFHVWMPGALHVTW